MILMIPVMMVAALLGVALAADNTPGGDVAAAPKVQAADPEQAPWGSAYLQAAVADLGGDVARANEGYVGALSVDLDNVALRGRVLEMALMSGDLDTALRLARSLDEIDQTTVSRLLKTAALAKEGKLDEAKKQLARVLKTAPDLMQFQLIAAYIDVARGVPMKTVVKRVEALKLPAALAARRNYHVGRMWLKAGKVGKAISYLERAYAVEPAMIFNTLLLAKAYAQTGNEVKMKELLADFKLKNPTVALIVPSTMAATPAFASALPEDISSALFDFALLVWAEGGVGPARQLVNMALWLDPRQNYVRYYDGILLEMGGDVAAAEKEYAVLARDPVLGLGGQLRLAEARYKQGFKEEGLRQVEALVAKHPQEMLLRRSLALLAFDLGDYERAAKEYEVMLTALPADALASQWVEMLFAQGAALERAGEYDEAVKALQKALELQPVNPQVMNYLAYMWVEKGVHVEEAFALLKKAHLLMPDDGAITDSLGWAYMKRGKPEVAVKYLEVAAEQEPESAEIIDHLGDVYMALGRKDEAVKYWKRALELVGRGGEKPQPDFDRKVQRKLERAD